MMWKLARDLEVYQRSLRDRSERLTLNSEFHVSCWEGVRDLSLLVPNSKCLVFRRFVHTPRYRIFNLNETPQRLLEVAKEFETQTHFPIRVVHVRKEDLPYFESLGGHLVKGKEFCLDMWAVANYPHKFWSHEKLETLNKLKEECKVTFDPPVEDMKQVLTSWESLNYRIKGYQRSRDLTFLEVLPHPRSITSVIYRWGQPSGLFCLFRLANYKDTLMVGINKSLSYHSLLVSSSERRDELADFFLYYLCQVLSNEGIRYLQWKAGPDQSLNGREGIFAFEVSYSLSVDLPLRRER